MPRTSFQNRAIKEQRSQEILDSALLLFSTKGFDKVSIDMIADDCHISHGLFYHYFASKDEILKALNASYIDQLCEALEMVLRDDDYGEVFFKKLMRILINNANSSDINNYYTKLFLDTILSTLNKNPDVIIFNKKIDNYYTKSLKQIKQSCTNISAKEFDNLLNLILLSLSAYCESKIKYPRLFRQEPDVDTIFTILNFGIKGSTDHQNID